MKKNFTLVLVLSIAMLQFANATTIINKWISKPNKKNVIAGKRLMGNPYKDNVLVFVLLSKPTTDTAYVYNGVACKTVFDSSFVSTTDNAGNQLDFNNGFGIGEDLSILLNGSYWGIRCWNLPTPKDTIKLDLVRVQSATNYQLLVDGSIYSTPGITAYVYDNYLKTTTKIKDSSIVTVNFTPNPDSAATYEKRFSIIFKSNTLPIKSISLNTTIKNSNVELNWSTIGETDMANYTVEKSLDGVHYLTINTVAAKNKLNASYAYTDNVASSGAVYYRIKATDKTGTVTYSKVSAITNSTSKGGFSVYPNPVRNNTINLNVTNIATGNYTLNVYTILGERVSSQQLQHNGGTATYKLSVDSKLTNGLYKLSIVSTTEKKVVFETSLLIKK